MLNESYIRQCIEDLKTQGWVIEPNIWFKFRDGRTPPKVSPWGCILANKHFSKSGNFIIPGGSWHSLVRNYLETTDECLNLFIDGFNGVSLSSMWMSHLDSESLQSYHLGKNLAKSYL